MVTYQYFYRYYSDVSWSLRIYRVNSQGKVMYAGQSMWEPSSSYPTLSSLLDKGFQPMSEEKAKLILQLAEDSCTIGSSERCSN